MTPTELLELQRTVGNRAATRVVQRVSDGGDTAQQAPPAGQTAAEDPRETLTGSLIGSVERGRAANDKIRKALHRRLKTGPPFTASELAAIQGCDPKWLNEIGIGTYQDADNYLGRGHYRDWSARKWVRWPLIKEGQRILIASLAWARYRPDADKHKFPSYTLGRTLHIRSLQGAEGQVAEELQTIIAERDEQIREAFVETLIPLKEVPEGADPNDREKVARAQQILTRVFLILQNGLKVYRKDTYNYPEEDVARALAHGGRVNIRIPELSAVGGPFALTDWVGPGLRQSRFSAGGD